MSQQEQCYAFEVGQLVIINARGLLQGTTEKITARSMSGGFPFYLISGKLYVEDDLEARTLDDFEQFLYAQGALDLYDRAAKVHYRVRAVLSDGRIQGEGLGMNDGTFTGTRAEFETFLLAREKEWNVL